MALGLALALAACSEKLTAPGSCPDFCQSASLALTDTVLLGAITSDSSFSRPNGYVNPDEATYLPAVSTPTRESRPIFRTIPIPRRIGIGTDTTTATLVGADSARLSFTITRRDTTANLVVSLYAMPLTIDTTTAFHDLDGAFAGPVVRSVNLDSLLTKPATPCIGFPCYLDPVTHDSAYVDKANDRMFVRMRIDTTQVPLVLADSGKVALGIRVSGNIPTSTAIAATERASILAPAPSFVWFARMDSAGKVIHIARPVPTSFDSFVYDPPSDPIGANLVIGGVPAVRTVIRIALPPVIRDSSRIVRATLEFIAAAQFQGTAADKFPVFSAPVLADFGAKSPLVGAFNDTTQFTIVPIDTVRVDVTRVLTYWTLDSRRPTTLVLRQDPEGTNFVELRMHSSVDAGLEPRLHITYTARYPLKP